MILIPLALEVKSKVVDRCNIVFSFACFLVGYCCPTRQKGKTKIQNPEGQRPDPMGAKTGLCPPGALRFPETAREKSWGV